MGTIYMILSGLLFLVEIMLQLYTASVNSETSVGVFIALMGLVVGPIIVVNFISALQVTRTQDFSGKCSGRMVCVVFHIFQLGMFWRMLKMLILYEERDWKEYMHLRLIHTGFQSLPFIIVLSVTMFMRDESDGASITTVVVALISSAIAVTAFGLGKSLNESEEVVPIGDKIRKISGIIFMTLSVILVLLSRCSSIVLFAVAEPYWVGLPIGVHFLTHLLSTTIYMGCTGKLSYLKFLKRVYISVINIFDLVEEGFNRVQCKYVFYYTAVLLENLSMTAVWMLQSSQDYTFTLMMVVIVLVGFIGGIIMKLASCGCIHKELPGLMGDTTFNSLLHLAKETQTSLPYDESERDTYESRSRHSSRDRPIAKGNSPPKERRQRKQKTESISTLSKESSRVVSNASKASSSRVVSPDSQYDNYAFVEETRQGHLNEIKDRIKRPRRNAQYLDPGGSGSGRKRDSRRQLDSSIDLASSLSRNSRVTSSNSRGSRIASSNSRNTNTINFSVQSYYNKGFNDEPLKKTGLQLTSGKGLLPNGISSSSSPSYDVRERINVANFPKLREILVDCETSTLQSSQIYPVRPYQARKRNSYNKSKMKWKRPKQVAYIDQSEFDDTTLDGYTTDISNSEYPSVNDCTMEDSSDWTSSCSSSDSDYAQTWPPSNTNNLLNIHALPKDKLSTNDSIIHWLNTVNGDVKLDATNSDGCHTCTTENSQKDPLQKFRIKTKHNKGRLKGIIPKPKGAILQFFSVNYKKRHKHSNSSHNNSNTMKPVRSSENQNVNKTPGTEAIKKWQPLSSLSAGLGKSGVTLSPDFVQESVV